LNIALPGQPSPQTLLLQEKGLGNAPILFGTAILANEHLLKKKIVIPNTKTDKNTKSPFGRGIAIFQPN
jgi:hypothetical protein